MSAQDTRNAYSKNGFGNGSREFLGDSLKQKMNIDFQIEMQKIKHELNRYEDLMRQQERDISERKFREKFNSNSQLSSENIQYKQERLLFERELLDKKRNLAMLSEDTRKIRGQLDKERESKIALLDQLQKRDQTVSELKLELQQLTEETIKKEQTIGELIKSMEKKSSSQKIEKQEQQISNKKQVEEELNKYKNELQYKFSQKEKRYKEIIEKLRQNPSQREEITDMGMSQSNQSSKNKWVSSSAVPKSQEEIVSKLIHAVQANSINDYFQKIEELQNYKKLATELQSMLQNVSQDVFQYPGVIVQIVQGLLEFHQQSGQQQNSDDILKQIQFCLNVKEPSEIVASLAQRIVLNEGYQRIVKRISRALKIKSKDLSQLEGQIYAKLGIEQKA